MMSLSPLPWSLSTTRAAELGKVPGSAQYYITSFRTLMENSEEKFLVEQIVARRRALSEKYMPGFTGELTPEMEERRRAFNAMYTAEGVAGKKWTAASPKLGSVVQFEECLRESATLSGKPTAPTGQGDFSLARRRYQKGSVLFSESRQAWLGRYREDVIQPNGSIIRTRPQVVLGNKKDLPTRRLATRKLDEILSRINDTGYEPTRIATVASSRSAIARKCKSTQSLHRFAPPVRTSKRTSFRNLEVCASTNSARKISNGF